MLAEYIGLVAWGAIVGVTVLLPVLGLWPPVTSGEANQNNVFRVEMVPPREQRQPYDAILAQEIAEYWLKWVGAAILSAPVAWYVKDIPYGWLPAILATFIATWWAKYATGQIEYIGHAVEIEYARRHFGAGDAYEDDEVAGMIRNYKAFEGLTPDEVKRGMRRRQWIVNALLVILALRIRTARKGR